MRISPVFGFDGRFEEAAPDHVVIDGVVVLEELERHGFVGAAIELADDDVLCNVDEASGEVPRVRRTQSGVGEALAGAVRRDEVLENGQAFSEVRLDRAVDDVALRVRHEASHTGQLADLLDVTSGSGVRHHVDGVELLEVVAIASPTSSVTRVHTSTIWR